MIDLGDYKLYPISELEMDDISFLESINDEESKKFSMERIIKQKISGDSKKLEKGYLVKENDLNVGYASLSNIKKNGDVVISFAIHKEVRKKRLATKLVGSISAYALNMDLSKGVVGYVDVKNEASKNVLRYNGFEYISTISNIEIYRKKG